MDKILKVLEGVYHNKSLRKSITPLFLGNPGLGKSVIIRKFAKDLGVKLVPFITSQRNPFEISGLALPDKDTKRMSYWDFDSLLDMKDGDILFFDELLNGNPTVLNACLTIIEEREMISGKKLPDIMIVAAANPQGMVPITPQIKERFVWYPVKFNGSMWSKYMFEKYGVVSDVVNKLIPLIKNETFLTNNFYTPRSLDKAIDSILHEVYTPYEETLVPLLSTLIKNELSKPIKLDDERELLPEELISWLELAKLLIKEKEKNGIITK